ncbi:MAG: PAS domain-containing protein [Thermodesulfobacteriota bacterium]
MTSDEKIGFLKTHRTKLIGSWILNVPENKVFLGDTTAQILEVDKETFDNSFDSILKMIHRDDFERVQNFMREVLKTREPDYYRLEHRIRKKFGEVRILSQIMRTSFDDQGRLTVINGTVSDVTDQRLAEKALKESEERYRSIFECSLAMLITVDNNRKITGFNPAAYKKLGYPPEEMLHQPISIIYADPEDEKKVSQALKKDGKFYGRIKNKKKTGEVFTVLLSAAILYDGEGNKVGTVGSSLKLI